MNQNQSFNTVDPFEEESILYLNPRTFQVSKDALKSTDPEAIHQYMKSMALQNPDKHLEEAKSVIDGGSKLLKTMENEANVKEKENIRGRRPELARKPSKFRMKPDTSQSSTLVEPTLELDHLHDPREFFAAYEKFERTKKELRKARGEPDEVITFKPRQRRPELPRKKSVYKHYEYPGLSQNDISVSQETLQDNIESQPSQSLQQESLTPKRKNEVEEDGSISKSEEKVNKLFNELMDSDIANLDENQALDLLKDRLNIKDVEIEDLDLPDFNEIPRVDFIGPVKTILEDSNRILSDARALPFVSKLGTQKELSDNHFQSFGSPTPPRNPFSAISELGRNMMKSLVSKSKDQFSTHDVDSPGPTPSRIFGGGSSLASMDKGTATLDLVAEKKITENAIGDALVATLDDNVDTDIQTNEDMNENAEDMVQKSASVTQVNSSVEDTNNDVDPHGVQDKDENVEDVAEKEGSPEVNAEVFEMEDLSQPGANSIESLDTSIPAQDPEIVPEQQNEEQPMKTTNKTKKTTNKRKKTTTHQAYKKKKRQIHAGQTDANSIEDMDTSIPTDIIHEQQDEEHTTMDKRKKTTQRKVDLKKKRQSLTGAGSSWTTGVRRSSRHTSRPLEFWKGERFLYGRVHNSLPTVIGVKYISPSKADFKVESFVSDEYKDLVEWAAFH